MIKYILLDLILSCLISIYINRDNLLYVIKQIIKKNNKIKLINKVNSMLIIGDNRLVNLNTGRFINTYNNKEIQGFYIDEKIIKKYLHI